MIGEYTELCIICDKCNVNGTFEHAGKWYENTGHYYGKHPLRGFNILSELEHAAEKWGWVIIDGKHLCPTCAYKIKK